MDDALVSHSREKQSWLGIGRSVGGWEPVPECRAAQWPVLAASAVMQDWVFCVSHSPAATGWTPQMARYKLYQP